ncbi:hypothetical protein [Nocardioides plantarum]|uniref:Uncharacterized protein n=1 Tax=Nocardioides plantarum TaxID=29299 RepID=A0ABV5KGJ7_9ACTN|nr:hypothetical protein [Nocardioides plantarum]
MRRSTRVVLGCVIAVSLVFGGGAYALVKTGAVDAMLNECTDEATDAANELADAVRKDLPGRTSAVELTGYCDKQPWPSVTTTTSADRATVARRLRARWGCTYAPVIDPRLDNGVVAPPWDCADVGGHEATVEVDYDGTFIADLG